MKAGTYVYVFAAVATGVLNILWGDFERGHEPIQAFGDIISGTNLSAYAIAASYAALRAPVVHGTASVAMS